MHALSRARWRMLAVYAALIALVATLLVAISAPVNAAYPGKDGRIAFLRFYSAQGSSYTHYQDLWTMRPNGTDPKALTDQQYVRDAVYSRDGAQLVYLADGNSSTGYLPELYVIESDGTDRAQVPTALHVESVDWLDGDTLVVVTRDDGIHSIEVATGQSTPLVASPGPSYKDMHVAVSPDGESIAWSRRWTTFNGTSYDYHGRLMQAGADGANQTELFTLYGPNGANAHPIDVLWHPDGTKLDWRYLSGDGYHWVRLAAFSGAVEFDRLDNSTLTRTMSPSGQYLAHGDSGYSQQITDLDGNVVFNLPKDTSVIRDAPISWQPTTTGLNPLDFTKPTADIMAPGGTVDQGATVLADYSCQDDRALASCNGTVPNGSPVDTATIGTETFEVTATDTSGNTSTRSVTYEVVAQSDDMAPTISLVSPAEGAEVVQESTLIADYACADETALASCVGDVPDGDPIDTSTVGDKTFTVTATDDAGNDTVTTVNYSVIWPFGGFTGPVGGAMLNLAKAGGVVPVRFSLGGDRGMGILASGYPKSIRISCDTSEQADPLEEYAASSPGNNTLSYDPSTGEYGYNWKTGKAWSGTCRRFVIQLVDGAEHTADFRFK